MRHRAHTMRIVDFSLTAHAVACHLICHMSPVTSHVACVTFFFPHSSLFTFFCFIFIVFVSFFVPHCNQTKEAVRMGANPCRDRSLCSLARKLSVVFICFCLKCCVLFYGDCISLVLMLRCACVTAVPIFSVPLCSPLCLLFSHSPPFYSSLNNCYKLVR